MPERSRLGKLALATQVALGISGAGFLIGALVRHGLGQVLDSSYLTGIGGASMVPAAILFIAWLLTAQSLLEERGIKQSRSAALLAWILCGLNLFMPYLVLRELESRARDRQAPPEASPRLRLWGVAWFCFLASPILRPFVGPLAADVVHVLSAVGGAFLAVRVVSGITALVEPEPEGAPRTF